MSPSASPAAWKRLGELLARRRAELDPRYQNRTTFSAERGLDYRLAYDIEEARRANFRTTTLAGIAVAYAVTLDSVHAVLRGDSGLVPLPASPVPLPPLPQDGEPDDEAARKFPFDPTKQALWRIPGLTGAERDELIAMLDRKRAEAAGHPGRQAGTA